MDERLRAVERRWQASGSLEDEAAYLVERVRQGDLTPERLELAAHVGYEPARQALLTGPPELRLLDAATRMPVADPRALLRGLMGRSREGLARYAVAVAQQRLGSLAMLTAHAALIATEQWIECPCDQHADSAAQMADALWEMLVNDVTQLPSDAREALYATALAAFVPSCPGEGTWVQPESYVHLLAHEKPGDRDAGVRAVTDWALRPN